MYNSFESYGALWRAFLSDSLTIADGQAIPPALEVRFETLARELFALQFAHVEPYRKLCELRKTTQENLKSWRDIPALPTTAFKDFDISSLNEAERTCVFHSSGTTEQRPSKHHHSEASLALYEESLLPWFERHLLPDRKTLRFIALTPTAKDAPNSSLVHMFETVSKAYGKDDSAFTGYLDAQKVWAVDLARTTQIFKEATSHNEPVLLLGTAFSFVHLLDHCHEQKLVFQLPAGSRVMETGGYKGRSRTMPKEELHQLITQYLGVPATHIVCEYGMSELSSQAYDRIAGDKAARVFQFPPWARALVVSPETGLEVNDGETGLLRVIDLANVRSVMAIQTEDLAVRRGQGFELIGRATVAEPRGCSLMSP